jgi:hypothetical protein
VKWAPGLICAVPLADGSFGVAQTGELMMPNIGYCALFSTRLMKHDVPTPQPARSDVVALLAVARYGITSGHWPVLAAAPTLFATTEFSNERFRNVGYVGSIAYDCALAEDLLSAFHGLIPWNDWKDENYLDTMLAPDVPRPPTARLLSADELASYRAAKSSGSSGGAV